MSIEDKLHELGIILPEAPAAVAAYQPWIRTGNLIFISGLSEQLFVSSQFTECT